jgi:16S rRNA (cytidine1402-2'-O)-methyltransferase
MLLTLPMDKSAADIEKGVLYVVATPIGHLEDITLRAIKTLAAVDLVVAEDTRHTGRLLAHHGISTVQAAYHEHNETTKIPKLINQLKAGDAIALVTDAGTPGVSDPGYRLVTTALADGIRVVPIPGVSALVTALSVSGLPTDSFIFIGFLPSKKVRRLDRIESLADEDRTLIFYESPRRVLGFIQELISGLGDRQAVLGREMTKLHEEFIRGRLSEIGDQLSGRSTIKGECTLLVAGNKSKTKVPWEWVQTSLADALAISDRPLSTIVKEVAGEFKVSRNKVYKEALKIKSDDI